ncbi:MAG: DMT family transporter [Bacillota bacterium]|nr:DMT family transporter [Bacillota bacterium]
MGLSPKAKADCALIMVALFWGVSYLLMDVSLADVESFNLNALRFLIAFFIAAAFSFPKLRSVNKVTLKYSAVLGALFVLVFIGATYGVMYTSLSNAGFLCCLSVVFTPVLLFFMGRKQEPRVWLVVLLALAGIALLSLDRDLRPALGDLLCIFCAMAYAVLLLVMEKAVRREEVDAYQIGVFQLGFAGAFNLILSLLLEETHLPSDGKTWAAVLFLAVFCTGVAYVIQALAQQYTSATSVGVIFCLEPVFAGVVAYVWADEVLLPRAYLGAVLLILSILLMEVDLEKLFPKRKKC